MLSAALFVASGAWAFHAANVGAGRRWIVQAQQQPQSKLMPRASGLAPPDDNEIHAVRRVDTHCSA
jgi:hypothetical protein